MDKSGRNGLEKGEEHTHTDENRERRRHDPRLYTHAHDKEIKFEPEESLDFYYLTGQGLQF